MVDRGYMSYNFILLKQRKNPFNSEVIASHSLEEKDSKLLDRAVDQTQTQTEGESSFEILLCTVSCGIVSVRGLLYPLTNAISLMF